ncbi:MAG: DNA (cytosine-5-)-methyltransferase [Candidatus Eremiobacterota bacterium]
MITCKSYFSGAGGMDLGLKEAGIEIIRSYEIDQTCCKTLKQNFSHDIHQEDITKITVLDQPKTDIIVGTFPCQKYSSGANINNSRTGDDLFLHFFRHIALERPEVYIVENVPGMRKFTVVMEALTRLPDYYIRIECPVNANIWLPQNRKRLILFGSKKPFNVQYPLFNKQTLLKDVLEKDPEVNIPDYVQSRLNGAYRDRPIISSINDIAPCCIAHYSKDLSTRLVNDGTRIRPYTVREYSRLQGFPDDFKFSGESSQIYRQVGNAVPPPMGKWIGEQIQRYFN